MAAGFTGLGKVQCAGQVQAILKRQSKQRQKYAII